MELHAPLYHVRSGETESMKCPTCGEETMWADNPSRPFCSERCRVIDLGKWASEEYVVTLPLEDNKETAENEER